MRLCSWREGGPIPGATSTVCVPQRIALVHSPVAPPDHDHNIQTPDKKILRERGGGGLTLTVDPENSPLLFLKSAAFTLSVTISFRLTMFSCVSCRNIFTSLTAVMGNPSFSFSLSVLTIFNATRSPLAVSRALYTCHHGNISHDSVVVEMLITQPVPTHLAVCALSNLINDLKGINAARLVFSWLQWFGR